MRQISRLITLLLIPCLLLDPILADTSLPVPKSRPVQPSIWGEQALVTLRGFYAREDYKVSLTSELFRLAAQLKHTVRPDTLHFFTALAVMPGSATAVLGAMIFNLTPFTMQPEAPGSGGTRKPPAQLNVMAAELVHGDNPSAEDLARSIQLNEEVLARQSEITENANEVIVQALIDLSVAHRKQQQYEKAFMYIQQAWDKAHGVEISFFSRLLLWEEIVGALLRRDENLRAKDIAELAIRTIDQIYQSHQRPKGADVEIPTKDWKTLQATRNKRDADGVYAHPRSLVIKYRNHFVLRQKAIDKRLQPDKTSTESIYVLLDRVDRVINDQAASEEQRQEAVELCDMVLERIDEITKKELRTRIYFVTLQKQAYVLAQGKHYSDAKEILERSLEDGQKEEVPLDVRFDTWQLGLWVYDHLQEKDALLKLAKLYHTVMRDIQRRTPPNGRGLYIPAAHREAIKRPGAQTAEVKAKLAQASAIWTKIVQPYLAAEEKATKTQTPTPPSPARRVEKQKKPAAAAENGGVGKKTAWKQSWDLYRARQFEAALDHLQMARDYEEAPFLAQLTRAQLAMEQQQIEPARTHLAGLLQQIVLATDPAIRLVSSKDPMADLLSLVTRRNFASRWAQKPADAERAVEILLAARGLYRSEGQTQKADEVLSLARTTSGTNSRLNARVEATLQGEEYKETRTSSRVELTAEDLHRLEDHFPEGFILPYDGYYDVMQWLLTHRFLDRSWSELVKTYGPIEDFHDLVTRYILFEILPHVQESDRAAMTSSLLGFEGGKRPFRVLFELEQDVQKLKQVPLTAEQSELILTLFSAPGIEDIYVSEAIQHRLEEFAETAGSDTGSAKDLGAYFTWAAVGYALGGPWTALAIILGGGFLIGASLIKRPDRYKVWFSRSA